MRKAIGIGCGILFVCCFLATITFAAYHHMTDTDSENFLIVYPDKANSKLDSCTLCHTGGQYEKKPGVLVSLGSCQWCHYSYGYDGSGNILETLNPYGMDYRNSGRNAAAMAAIEPLDSDADGFVNIDEIMALRYPGNAQDDPTKVTAPYRVYNKSDLQLMTQHSQFLLMNTHKSADFYAQYSGVAVSTLLNNAGISNSASGILVFAPDGWSQYHPLEFDDNPLFYHVYGVYPQANYYYNEEADIALNPTDGWCEYNAPGCAGRNHGDPINNPDGLRMILAFLRNGEPLTPGELTPDNKLDGEGPYRIVPPQKTPGPPDQRSTAGNQNVRWPFDENADHSAGYSTRSATIIKVEPLPEGTTDIDNLEAGWGYIDDEKVVVYGAIDPQYTILEKIDALMIQLNAEDKALFKNAAKKRQLIKQLMKIYQYISVPNYQLAATMINKNTLPKMDGCGLNQSPDKNDWIQDCLLQKQVCWSLNEILILINIGLSGTT